MNKFERRNAGILVSVVLVAAVLLAVLYVKNQIPVEKVPETQPSSLEDWTLEGSALNGVPLEEDKGIYEQNNNIYDVYISVFPTKDSDGTECRYATLNGDKTEVYRISVSKVEQILAGAKKGYAKASADYNEAQANTAS